MVVPPDVMGGDGRVSLSRSVLEVVPGHLVCTASCSGDKELSE